MSDIDITTIDLRNASAIIIRRGTRLLCRSTKWPDDVPRLPIIEVNDIDDVIAASADVLKVANLIAVAEAAHSVLSETGVKEFLSTYNMGVELIDRLASLECE